MYTITKSDTAYDKQAKEFMNKTGTEMKSIFIGYKPYFYGEKEKRDVYQIVLKRGEKSYSFMFGQSLKNSSKPAGHGLRTKGENPTIYDVLVCLVKYDVGTFEDFCANFGYDTDSRRAEKTYNAVKEQVEALKDMFTEKELELMSEIQ